RALVLLANQNHTPYEHREAAVRGLAVAINHHGIMLTRDEIVRQQQFYRESTSADPKTRRILGGIMNALEIPYKKRLAAEPIQAITPANRATSPKPPS